MQFEAFLECGILAHGFLRLHCGDCGHDKLVAFSCKRREFCPSCGARRMAHRHMGDDGRGAVVDARALIAALKAGTLGSLGLDVYEEEADLFFRDLSGEVIRDDVFARLLTFPNVLITGHQAFFTEDAMAAIATTTLANLDAFEDHGRPLHAVSVERLA